MSGWCLQRLRTTCTLWAFVRTGIVDKVWEEELPPLPPPPMISMERSNSGEKPPIPPRKRGLWGIASAIGERAASWSGEEKDKAKRMSIPAAPAPLATSTATTAATTSSHLPPAPPTHPSLAQAPPALRRMPPPLPPARGDTTMPDAAKPGAVPPPLPRRSEGRTRSSMGHLPSPPPEAETTAEEPAAEAEAAPPTGAVDADASAAPEPDAAPAHTHAPTSIPLPESLPATPAGPSRAVSPAVALAAGLGATPPPIPRRAAARTRPVPGGSRPATPTNAKVTPVTAAAAAPTSPERARSKPEDAKEVADAVDGAPAETDRTPAAEAVDGEKAASEGGDSGDADSPPPDQSMSSSDVFVDALTPAQSEEDVVAPADPEPISEADGPVEEKLEENEEQDDKATIVDAPVGAQPVLAEVEAEKDLSDVSGAGSTILSQQITEEPLIVNGADEKDPTEAESEQEENEKNEEKEKNRPGYVGDGTWEEKTWKELVRLREDMFWARVGRVRD